MQIMQHVFTVSPSIQGRLELEELIMNHWLIPIVFLERDATLEKSTNPVWIFSSAYRLCSSI